MASWVGGIYKVVIMAENENRFPCVSHLRKWRHGPRLVTHQNPYPRPMYMHSPAVLCCRSAVTPDLDVSAVAHAGTSPWKPTHVETSRGQSLGHCCLKRY